MKKCPTCDKTFEDTMRFCQVDGAVLVDDEPAFDPYATMVAQPKPSAGDSSSSATQSEDASPIVEPQDVLDLPEADPLRTMYVSDAEMREMVGDQHSEADIVDVPPIVDSPAPGSGFSEPSPPEPPVFSIPDIPAPSFGDISPPPSLLSTADSFAEEKQHSGNTFNEAETVYSSPAAPFEPLSSPAAEWTPPPAPDSSWQNQQIGANTPFQPPMAGAGGQNKTLAIVSLVCGILSLICCSWFLPGIAAIVMGFIARSKAKADPSVYGGEGLALGGIITGGISLLLGVIVIILYFAGMLAGALGSNF